MAPQTAFVPPYHGNREYIFISYSHQDRDRVFPLLRAMADSGFRLWYDEGIDPGSEWPESIARHLENCAVCLAFLSENAVNSTNCRREINFAISRNKPFLSVLLEPVHMSSGMELQISSYQFLMLYKYAHEEEFLRRLSELEVLQSCRDRRGSPAVSLDGESEESAWLWEEEPTIGNPSGSKPRYARNGFAASPAPQRDDPAAVPEQPLRREPEAESTARQPSSHSERKEPLNSEKKKKGILAAVLGFAALLVIGLILWKVIIPGTDKPRTPADEEEFTASLASAAPVQTPVPTVEPTPFVDAEAAAPRERLSVGIDHIVGLNPDGTVVAAGSNSCGQCNVTGWTDIVAVSAGFYHTVGLRADGTVVAAGASGENDFGQCNVSGWEGIIAIAAGEIHTVGLKPDGTVVAVGAEGGNDFGQCGVAGWRDMIAISAEAYHTVGLRANGTVAAAGDNAAGQCEVSGWEDIVAVSAGYYHTIGLKADGSLVSVGSNGSRQRAVEDWTDILFADAGADCTAGLRRDGTVLVAGNPDPGSEGCDVSAWNLGPG